MLKINKLNVGVDDKNILNNINLEINKGELHVIMGRNGTGKSTLSNIITGKDGYNIGGGEVLYKNKNLLDMSTEDRALEGIFMSFQYPVSIPGLNTMHFLRTSVNSIRKHQNKEEYSSGEFIKVFKEKLAIVGLDESFAKRSVNDGFSGGEKKRFEILQMLLIEPKLVILDETDSGLDIDALRIVANGINNFKSKNNSFLLITHYYRIIEYLNPDFVHVLLDVKIVKSGDQKLALKLEENGYGWLKK
ncbi:MAG: Fe-S cluster assembly ATPase SufC [Candidatus Marinimicrobia bacterium]|nr:Fe-S cluster assembly ATPase SufC [Candidatus Neomarinimicrobiota bacterium]